MTAQHVLQSIWDGLGLAPEALAWAGFSGTEPALPSSFHVGRAAAAAIASAGLVAAELWRLRTGRGQGVRVDLRHACAEFHSEHFLRLDGAEASERNGALTGMYQAGDGGWVRIHANFPHHAAGAVALLGCDASRDAVARALLAWQARDFEQAAADAGLPVTAARSFAEWDGHAQGQAVPRLALVRIEQIGDAPPEPLKTATRPLCGMRVLELTRVIAGPVSGRTLAAHGAEVMNVTGPGLPSYGIEDLGRGKLAAQLDLRSDAGKAGLAGLIRGADVFVQGYRPGAIAGLGFSPEAATALRPGLVTASLSAYGAEGPWCGRRGFDSLVQTASGFNLAEAEAAGQSLPRPLPVQALDHATGYLLAAGIMTALYRRATVGGSWHVSVSLARTGHWLRGLGRVTGGFAAVEPGLADIGDLLETRSSGFGQMTAVRHAAVLEETPARWERPSMPLGSHAAVWPE